MWSNQWKELLKQWSRDILDSEYRQYLPDDAIASGWLGFPGATEERIQQVEVRLNAKLPPSYRDFLKVSNGWRMTTPFIDKLWSAEEIEWFEVKNQEWIDAWIAGVRYLGEPPQIADDDYFVYGEKQPPLIREDHLRGALEIGSGEESDVYLLIPLVISSEGEWEASYFSAKFGAERYRSFWQLMIGEYETFIRMKN